ncbi:methyltransferase domain-containing protein [Metallumcola ferriviriculae]|uniref:Methyltransferase domain-containing protein n=1 Tax=Metallumcola ferriviriculae TaxID=3039180 RepID=A0AAU0USS4_9FIRM|nr:methyltransferase domain-containing protein [Desulfitibacteraceae bacterium MK1]
MAIKQNILIAIECNINKGNLRRAKELLSHYYTQYGMDEAYCSTMAVIHIHGGQYPSAQVILEQGLRINAINLDLLFNLAFLQFLRGDIIYAGYLCEKIQTLSNDENLITEVRDLISKIDSSDPSVKRANHRCNICSSEVNRFLPWGGYISPAVSEYQIIGSDIENFSCPRCRAHDRERHMVLFFDTLDFWQENIIGRRVLHMAPEKHIKKIIDLLGTVEYVRGDLYPTSNDVKRINITNINYENNHFDFIICNHVLEHIVDDQKAIKELYRVLKPGGKAVLQTPYSAKIKVSYEDETIVAEQNRLEKFGQADHVRIYGLDFFERLKAAGFEVAIIQNSSLFTKEDAFHYGFNEKEDLILVQK